MHWYMPGKGYELRIVAVSRFQQWTQRRSKPSFLGASTSDAPHFIVDGSIRYLASIRLISVAENCLAVDPALLGTECAVLTSSMGRSMPCFAAFIRQRRPSHILWYYVSTYRKAGRCCLNIAGSSMSSSQSFIRVSIFSPSLSYVPPSCTDGWIRVYVGPR